jgi:hypothetical protein
VVDVPATDPPTVLVVDVVPSSTRSPVVGENVVEPVTVENVEDIFKELVVDVVIVDETSVVVVVAGRTVTWTLVTSSVPGVATGCDPNSWRISSANS